MAVKRALARQMEQSRQARGLSKSAMGQRIGTGRPRLDRLLDPTNTQVQLNTLQRAATALGSKLVLGLVS